MTTPVIINPAIRYPSTPITPHGSHYLRTGKKPNVRLKAFDDSIWFEMMGGRSIPDRSIAPESVQVREIKGLVAPWQTIDQKGATEDGVHFVDALYDPIEINLGVSVRGRNGLYLERTTSDLIASIDAKQTSELSWFTTRLGLWWSDVRWFKAPPENWMPGGARTRQDLSLILRGDLGAWRSFDSAAGFKGNGTAFMEFTNLGDQQMFPRFTCFGPGTFKMWNGPGAGANEYVQFGPLLPGQVAQIRTDPRRRGVVDLTQKPQSTQEQQQFNNALTDLKSFTQVLSVFQSIFGILGTGPIPPQGNMHSLLKGRFNDFAAISAKSPGRPAVKQKIKVEVSGGDGNTMILAAGTPLRRFPY